MDHTQMTKLAEFMASIDAQTPVLKEMGIDIELITFSYPQGTSFDILFDNGERCYITPA